MIDDLSITVTSLYKMSENKVIPSNARKGIFTVFVDDNMDQNSSSSTATMHFHGTSVSMFQFPIADVPGIKRQRPALNELSQKEKDVGFCVLEKYLNVDGYKLSVKGAYYPIQRVNVSEQLLTQIKTCFKEEKHIEYQWLTNVATLIGTTVEISSSAISKVNISWTKFHIAKM